MSDNQSQADHEEEVDRMASHLLARNMRAVKDAIQSQANELAHVRGTIIDMQQTMNTLIQEIQQMKQLQVAGLAANKGTGPTA